MLGASMAGCGGGHSALPAAASPAKAAPSANGKFPVTIKIDTPKTTGSANKRHPQYVSPATTQLAIAIVYTSGPNDGSSVSGYPATVSLTPTSGGCASTIADTFCQLSLSLAPGDYAATLTAEDANGTALSQAQSVPFTVTAGAANTIALTLSGVPASIVVSSAATAIHGSATEGFTIYGKTVQKLLVNALDADGNVIVGPGSPTFTASVTNGAGSWLPSASPASTSPNSLTVAPPGTNDARAQIQVAASYSDGTCSISGAVCSATFTITDDIQRMYIADTGDTKVTWYDLPLGSGGSSGTFSATSSSYPYYEPVALALGRGGNVYVLECNQGCNGSGNPPDGVAIYDRNGTFIQSILDPGTKAVFNNPKAIAVDKSGNIYVANAGYLSQSSFTSGANSVVVFAPGSSTPTQTIALAGGSSGVPKALAFDPSGNLLVETAGGIIQYTNALTAPTAAQTIAYGGNTMIADSFGTVIIGGVGTNAYAPTNGTYSSTAYLIVANQNQGGQSDAYSLAVDSQNTLYVGDCGSTCGSYQHEAVDIFTQAQWQTCSTANSCDTPASPPISVPDVGQKVSLAVDAFGTLYVADVVNANFQDTGHVNVYTPPFTNSSAPSTTLTPGSFPSSIAITP